MGRVASGGHGKVLFLDNACFWASVCRRGAAAETYALAVCNKHCVEPFLFVGLRSHLL